MNVTKISYLFDLMETEGFKFFTISDSRGSIMLDQSNTSLSPESARDYLKNFLDHNSGTFVVEFRRHQTKQSNSRTFTYTIDNRDSSNANDNVGIGSLGLGGMDVFGIIREKDEKIDGLNRELFTQMIGSLNKQNEMQMELLKKNLNKDTKGDAVLQTAIAAIQSLFGQGVGQVGLSGFDGLQEQTTQQPMSNGIDETRARINKSVVTLMQNDANFADNIEALARLATEQPMVYKMAVERLKDI